MPINKLLSILDASEPTEDNFEYTKPSFNSKIKTIKKYKKNQDEDDILKICVSYLIQKKVTGILFIGNKVISKNHYLNTFL